MLQKVLIVAEVLFTAGCFANSIVILKYGRYDPKIIANGLPLFGLIFLSIFIVVILPRYHPGGTTHDRYIRDNYPDIWRRFHNAPIEHDPAAVLTFCRGVYDNGTDEKLNEIKFSVLIYEILFFWPWPVTVISMIFNHVWGG
jgi:hypothetical protein